MKNKILECIRIIIVSMVVFEILPDKLSSFSFLIPLLIFVLIYIFIKYGFKNYRLNKKVIEIAIILSITSNYKLIIKNRKKIVAMLNQSNRYNIFILAIIGYFFLILFREKEKANIDELPVLIKQREYDLNRLKSYLKEEDTNIVGLNGSFGMGKSIIIDYLKRDFKSDFYFIEIDVLSSNSDDIQIILMNEIDKLLRSKGIFSRYSPKLRSFFSGNNILKNIELGFFYEDTIFVNMIRGIKQEVYLLDRPLLIIYEDLDRINNFEVIQKILGISEKLASNHIKIIYQYSKINLENIVERELGNIKLSNNYLEKYIHKDMNLTSIDLLEMIKFQLKINDKYNEYISSDLIVEILYVDRSFQINDYKGAVKLEFKPYLVNMRRVEKFLSSAYSYIKKNDNDSEKDIISRTAIIFYLIEFFIPESYSKIAENKQLEEIFIFKYKGEDYTLAQLYKNEIDMELLFKDTQNRLNVWILSSLNYKLTYNYKNEEAAREQRNRNSKIDKRFKNIYSAGILQYTNYELYAFNLIKEVLNHDKDLWESKYKIFNDYVYNTSELNVFYFGIARNISMFKSFNMINAGQKEWLKLIELCELQGLFDVINKSMFEAFSYIDLSDIKINIEIGRLISKADVVGNLNEDKYFIMFLKRYYRNWYGLTTLTDIELIEYTKIDLKSEDGKEEIISILERHIGELEKLKGDRWVEVLNNKFEIEINIEVTKKIIEVINEKYEVKERFFSSEFRSIESEEVKLLKKLKEDNNLVDFKLKAREFYQNNKITKVELKNLLK